MKKISLPLLKRETWREGERGLVRRGMLLPDVPPNNSQSMIAAVGVGAKLQGTC